MKSIFQHQNRETICTTRAVLEVGMEKQKLRLGKIDAYLHYFNFFEMGTQPKSSICERKQLNIIITNIFMLLQPNHILLLSV
jgi:hypothetical protein